MSFGVVKDGLPTFTLPLLTVVCLAGVSGAGLLVPFGAAVASWMPQIRLI